VTATIGWGAAHVALPNIGQAGKYAKSVRGVTAANVVEDQGNFAREANDTQSGDISARLTELKSTLRQQVVEIEAVKAATARTTAAVKEISTGITRRVTSSEKTTEPVVQQGWTPGMRQIDEERSPELSAETLNKLPRKVTVLLFASEPRGQPPVSLDAEIREITAKINEARFGELIDLQPWLAAHAFDVIPSLNQYRPHMVQFSGHGTPEGVLMMGPRNRSEPLAADRLMQMLKWTSDELRIAFFNICDSEAHARAAAEIFEASIGMRGQIKDMAARRFAAALYSGLAFGHSFQNSFQQACAAIGHLPDSAAPQLFFRDGIDPHKVVLVRPDS
jgi:hypothetical protein